MFVRFLGGLLLLLALAWAVAYIAGTAVLRNAREKPWPYGLGSIDEMNVRHQIGDSSKEAYELLDLAIPIDPGDAAGNYLGLQTAKRDDAVDPLPADVAAFRDDERIARFERLLLDRGERIRFGGDRFHPNLQRVSDVLAALALDRARAGDTAAAWEHLRAVSILARALREGRCWGGRRMADRKSVV